jgi:hypothetical protein
VDEAPNAGAASRVKALQRTHEVGVEEAEQIVAATGLEAGAARVESGVRGPRRRERSGRWWGGTSSAADGRPCPSEVAAEEPAGALTATGMTASLQGITRRHRRGGPCRRRRRR